MTLFQYAIFGTPTEKQTKDEGLKAKVLAEPKCILAADMDKVKMSASMDIPAEYRDQLDQITIAVRPF